MPAGVAPIAAPGTIPPQPSINQPAAGQIPFRAASPQKLIILDSTAKTMLTMAIQLGPDVIQGEGFIEELSIRVSSAATGGATVAYTEDGRRASLVNIILTGPGGDIFNLTGEGLTFVNEYDGKVMDPYESSSDVAITQGVSSSSATSGSFVQWYRLPLAIGYRNLVGLVGNQDRATKYRVRNDLNASAQIFSTAPATLASTTVTRYYRERAVPAAQDNQGNAQTVSPPANRIIHYVMGEFAGTIPATGKITHYFTGLGNTFRRIVLIWRQGTSGSQTRALGEALWNVNISPMPYQVKLGDNVWLDEDFAIRRRIMFDRYGWDAPNGVLVFDLAADFGVHSGEELGDDFLNTQNVVNFSLVVTYPASTTGTGNTLEILKDSLYVPSDLSLPSLMV